MAIVVLSRELNETPRTEKVIATVKTRWMTLRTKEEKVMQISKSKKLKKNLARPGTEVPGWGR
jgi:hypothetical protein